MPIDAGIFNQVGQQAAPPNMLAQLAQVEQIKRYQALGEKEDRTNALMEKRNALLASPDFQTGDATTRANLLYGAGDIEGAGKVTTTAAAAAKDQRDTQRIDLEMAIKGREAMSGGFMQLAQDPSQAPMLLKQMVDQRIMTPEYAQKVLQGASSAPDPRKFFSMGAQAAVSAKDQLEQQYKQMTFGETQRHNVANETNAARTAATGEQRLAMDQSAPRQQVVQGPDGPIMVDPRTGQGSPVTVGGQAVGPKLKDLPVSVNTAIQENRQTVGTLDRAIALLEGNDVGEQKGDKAATGWKGYLPNGALNRIDPKGVDARAEIADIGSLKIHDRSGAAVTLSEAPRLMPFIPLATDDRDTALKKLRRLKTEADNAGLVLSETYSKDQGYKPSPVLGKTAAPAAPAAPPAAGGTMRVTNAADYANVPSGATYTTPDGKTRRKP